MVDVYEEGNEHESAPSLPVQISSSGLLPILDISPDAIIVVNQAGIIVMGNRQVEDIFGYSHQELLSQPLERLLPQRFHEAHGAHRMHYFSAPRTRPMGAGLQLFGRRKDGTEFPVDISLKPLLLDGQLHVLGAIRDMTAQQAAEQERLQQAQHLRLQNELINMAHDAILVRDQLHRIISWNQGAEKLYGWTAQQALGRISHNLLKTRFPTSRAAVDTQLEQDGRWEGELTHTRSNGSVVFVESRQVLIRDETNQSFAILEINRDITERRRQEQMQHAIHTENIERLSFLQQVLDALPNSVYLVSGSDARLLLANSMTSRIWGGQWQINQPMLEFLINNGIEVVDMQGRPLSPSKFATIRAVQRGETVLQHQEIIHHPDGTSLPVLVSAVSLTAQHGIRPPQHRAKRHAAEQEPVALVIHQDVTALKEAEYLKDEFLGIAAHELRTPLASLAGYADMLIVQTARGRGSPLTEWQQEALEEIKIATNRLVSLTEDLLDVTRLQAGQLHLQRDPTDVVPLVQRVARQLLQRSMRHHIEVHSDYTALIANIDSRRVEQVVTNLIDNAIKYSPQGGTITIIIQKEPDTHAVRISVEDKGIGIPRHQQPLIFGRFMRADNARAWGINGTGLGLYLCHELVEQLGGQLWFESEEGTGTTFFVTLPLIDVS